MDEYNIDDQMSNVGRSCKQFRAKGALNRSISSIEDISCSSCRNWSGSDCVKKAFDNVLISTDEI